MTGLETHSGSSFPIPPAMDGRLAALADSLDRPKAWVIEQALEQYLLLQTAQLAAIDQGLATADSGRFVSHEAVEAWVESWGSDHERPKPQCE